MSAGPSFSGSDAPGLSARSTPQMNKEKKNMMNPDVNETIVRMSELHQGQLDKLGAPYYFHPMRVMMRLGPNADEAEKHAALLHDTLEDVAGVTPEKLRELGYSEEVVAMTVLLTRSNGTPYPAFIDAIIASGNTGAMRIKLADLYDNTNEERLNDAPDEIREKLSSMARTRYQPAIAKLKLALGQEAETVISGGLDSQVNAKLWRASHERGNGGR